MTFQFPDPNQIPVKEIPLAMTQLNALMSSLAARLVTEDASKDAKHNPEDRLLTVEDAAELLSVSRGWLYRNAKNLPFTRRLSRKQLRFSYQGLIAWRDRKKH